MFLVRYVLLTIGIVLNRYFGDYFFFTLKNSKVSYTFADVVRIPNLICYKAFPERNLLQLVQYYIVLTPFCDEKYYYSRNLDDARQIIQIL